MRIKQKFVALSKESCEEHTRSNLAQNSNTPRSQDDYITQVSEENEDRVAKKLSKEFSRSENHILGAFSRLDEILLKPLIQGHSETAPETSRNALGINQRMNENDSQSDPYSEASISQSQTTRNSGPDDTYENLFVYKKTNQIFQKNLSLEKKTIPMKFFRKPELLSSSISRLVQLVWGNCLWGLGTSLKAQLMFEMP